MAKGNPTSAEAQRDLRANCTMVSAQCRDKTWFEDALEIDRKLAKTNPTSAEAQRDLSISYERLGEIAMRGAKPDEARKWFDQSLSIIEPLAKASPTSAHFQRHLAVTCLLLGLATNERHYFARARDILRKLDASHRLAPTDQPLLAELEEFLGP